MAYQPMSLHDFAARFGSTNACIDAIGEDPVAHEHPRYAPSRPTHPQKRAFGGSAGYDSLTRASGHRAVVDLARVGPSPTSTLRCLRRTPSIRSSLTSADL